MYNQTKALKEGKSVEKPIYNHVSGKLDPAEKIESPQILVPAQLDRPVPSPAGNAFLMSFTRVSQ